MAVEGLVVERMNSPDNASDGNEKDPVPFQTNEMNRVIEPISFQKVGSKSIKRKFTFRPLITFLLLAFFGLALVALFMFTARAVKLDVVPVPTEISIQGAWPTWELGGRYLMQSGTYSFSASLSGYHDMHETILVNDDADQLFTMEMSKLPGILTITSTPSVDSEIVVDQQKMGTLPLTIDAISPGLHDISIISDRYQTYDTDIEIEGMRQHQSLTIELLPAWATYNISTNPPNAQIMVNNQVIGNTPAAVEILQGSREIVIKLAGYKSWNTQVEVHAGENQTIPAINLIKADGTLALRSLPTGASVTVSGQFKGVTPLDLKLAPGKSYQVSLSKAGYQSGSREVDIKPDEDTMLEFNLAPVLGIVQLVVTPEGGELIIDGKSFGEPSQRLSLTAQEHLIEIHKEGFATFNTSITPRPGFDQRLQVDLKTLAQAKADSIPQTIVTASGQSMKFVVPSMLTLGASRREPGRRSNEIERQVELVRPFYISVHEVNNKDFKEFDISHSSGMLSRVLLDQEDRPVVNVSWERAAAYCNWLSKRDGLEPAYSNEDGNWQAVLPLNTGYRLPTEAEWSWISRYAGYDEPLKFPWGNTMPPNKNAGNFADESAKNLVNYYIKDYHDNYRGTAPIGSFAANRIGLHDLNGNVAEWIHDFYSTSPVAKKEVSIDPAGPAKGKNHVIRGASFLHGRFSELRWTFRDYGLEGRDDVGFRIARYHEPIQ